jgi:hypothetical protein
MKQPEHAVANERPNGLGEINRYLSDNDLKSGHIL